MKFGKTHKQIESDFATKLENCGVRKKVFALLPTRCTSGRTVWLEWMSVYEEYIANTYFITYCEEWRETNGN